MTDSKLSREHSLALLHKLATDDGFRIRYEQAPAAALAELGVPPATITHVTTNCRVSGTLAEKAAFAQARQQLLAAGAEACVQMAVPDPRLDFGKP
jgi:putative modified peptide